MNMKWKYQKKILKVEDIPEGAIGFIYVITRISDGKPYIGKKVLNFTRRKRLTKKEKLLKENTRKRYKVIVSDSGWENYTGSCKDLNADILVLGEKAFKKEILKFCFDKRSLTYEEVKSQFEYNVLEINSYNGCIAGKFYKPK